MFFSLGEIFWFHEKQLCKYFHRSKTCKNEPGPPVLGFLPDMIPFSSNTLYCLLLTCKKLETFYVLFWENVANSFLVTFNLILLSFLKFPPWHFFYILCPKLHSKFKKNKWSIPNLKGKILLTLPGKSEVQKVLIPQNGRMRFYLLCFLCWKLPNNDHMIYIKIKQLFEDKPVHNNRPKIFRPFPDKI